MIGWFSVAVHQIRPPVPTKGARRVAELAFMRFIRERIRLIQKKKGEGKKVGKQNPHRRE